MGRIFIPMKTLPRVLSVIYQKLHSDDKYIEYFEELNYLSVEYSTNIQEATLRTTETLDTNYKTLCIHEQTLRIEVERVANLRV